jgi:hypothetical protein
MKHADVRQTAFMCKEHKQWMLTLNMIKRNLTYCLKFFYKIFEAFVALKIWIVVF